MQDKIGISIQEMIVMAVIAIIICLIFPTITAFGMFSAWFTWCSAYACATFNRKLVYKEQE